MTERIVHQAEAALPNIPLKVISQGAEAVVFETLVHPYRDEPKAGHSNKYIVKYRPPKPYRHPKIDKQITKARTVGEAKFMAKLLKLGVPLPALIAINAPKGVLWMGYLGHELPDGLVSSLKNWLWYLEKNTPQNCESEEVQTVLVLVGNLIAKLHLNDMIHGDLTSSNILLEKNGNQWEPHLIDFGLSSYSNLAEDRAVDLYVLERAVKSTHSVYLDKYNNWILQGYEEKHQCKEYKKHGTAKLVDTMRRLEDVRLRGRKRSMLG